MLLIRGILGVWAQVSGLIIFLLVPAGTWYWPRALVFIAGHAILLGAGVVFLALKAPRSLEARMEGLLHASQPVRDRIITISMSVLLCAWVAFVSLDANRLHLLPAPPMWISAIGGIVSALGLLTILTALYQNAYAAPIVKDQSERGQTLIDTGLYGRVRHPFYAGFVAYQFGLGLWMGSLAGLIVVPLLWALLAARIHIEEQTLCKMLAPYPDYMKRVRYRIVPGIW